MKRMIASILLSSGLALAAGCADETADRTVIAKKKNTGDDSLSGKAASLVLSWNAQSGISAYHVYYVDPKQKVLEIDSLQKDSPLFTSPKIAVDSTNMESWPATGSKACFYVVAESSGALSDPSDKACITL